jgi:hypothetical protein
MSTRCANKTLAQQVGICCGCDAEGTIAYVTQLHHALFAALTLAQISILLLQRPRSLPYVGSRLILA